MNELPEPVLTVGEPIEQGTVTAYPVYLDNASSYSGDTTLTVDYGGTSPVVFQMKDINNSAVNGARGMFEYALTLMGYEGDMDEFLSNIAGYLLSTGPLSFTITLSLTGYESVSATVEPPAEPAGETLTWTLDSLDTIETFRAKETTSVNISSETIDDFDFYATAAQSDGTIIKEKTKLNVIDSGALGISCLTEGESMDTMSENDVIFQFLCPCGVDSDVIYKENSVSFSEYAFFLKVGEDAIPCTITLEIIPKASATPAAPANLIKDIPVLTEDFSSFDDAYGIYLINGNDSFSILISAKETPEEVASDTLSSSPPFRFIKPGNYTFVGSAVSDYLVLCGEDGTSQRQAIRTHKCYIGFDGPQIGLLQIWMMLTLSDDPLQADMACIQFMQSGSRISAVIDIKSDDVSDALCFGPYGYAACNQGESVDLPESILLENPIIVDIDANASYFTSLGLTTDDEIKAHLDAIAFDEFS